MAYFFHCCVSITSKNYQLPTLFRRSCQGFYPPHHHHPHDHPHHHHHHHHHPSHYHCHDNLFRSWRSTMSWGPKLPKGRNLASQRFLLWWVWWSGSGHACPCLELLLWWFGMIMMIVSGSGHARPRLELGAGGGCSKMGWPVHFWSWFGDYLDYYPDYNDSVVILVLMIRWLSWLLYWYLSGLLWFGDYLDYYHSVIIIF